MIHESSLQEDVVVTEEVQIELEKAEQALLTALRLAEKIHQRSSFDCNHSILKNRIQFLIESVSSISKTIEVGRA